MSRRVLIVDDDPNLRRTFADILRLKGYDPSAVETGSAALEAARQDPPAVALIDLRLEDMSGLDVLRGLKELDETIACIVLTGYASQRSAIDAVNLGAYSYVEKPPNIPQLLLTIQRAIEKQTADLALHQSQALLHSTGRIAKVGGWEIDVASRTLIWTEEIYRIYGVDLEFEPTLAASLAFYPTPVRAGLELAFVRLLETGEAFDLELPFETAAGEHLWVHLMGKTDTGEAHTPAKVSGTFQDITERKHAEEALRLSNRRLEQALAQLREAQAQVISQERMAAVGQLAAGLAHEYNNLMATIILYADMMLRGSSLNHTDRDRISAIYEQGQRAADLTQQILDFSRKAILRKQEVAVTVLLQELKSRLHPLLSERIVLSVDTGHPSWRINADPDRLRQALMNLALNARDAMPDGGTLRIWAEPQSIDASTVPQLQELKPGEWLVFHVQDSGLGIDPEVLPHIFEPFFTTRSPMSSGLGLSQVHGTIRQHNGTVAVNTEVGKGSTFSIYLPAMLSARILEDEGLAAGAAAAGGPYKEPDKTGPMDGGERSLTLVIEEHELMRGALVAALESLSYRSLAFASIDDATRVALDDRAPAAGAPPFDRQEVRLVLNCLNPGPSPGGSAATMRWPDRERRGGWDFGYQADSGAHRDSAQDVRDLKDRFPRARVVLIGDKVSSPELSAMLRSGLIRWLEKPVDLVKLAEVLADIEF